MTKQKTYSKRGHSAQGWQLWGGTTGMYGQNRSVDVCQLCSDGSSRIREEGRVCWELWGSKSPKPGSLITWATPPTPGWGQLHAQGPKRCDSDEDGVGAGDDILSEPRVEPFRCMPQLSSSPTPKDPVLAQAGLQSKSSKRHNLGHFH